MSRLTVVQFPDFKPATGSRLLAPWALRQLYHRAELSGSENIPSIGPVLLVSNHGRLDFDVFILIRLILKATGRFARSMADRIWFKSSLTAKVAHGVGAVEGNQANAKAMLQTEHILLTYPGGVPEIMNSKFGQEKVDWTDRTGFARLAIEQQVPVVPIASLGVNNGFVFLTKGNRLGKILYKWIFRMGDSYKNYRDPLVLGLIPIPLPFSMAVHFPLPCKVRYIVGKLIQPPEVFGDVSDAQVLEFAKNVEATLNQLITKNRST